MTSLEDVPLDEAKPAVDRAFRLALRHRRIQLGKSAADLSAEAGFGSNSTLCHAESGHFGLQLANAWRFSRALGMSLDEMLELGESLVNQEEERALRRALRMAGAR